MKDQRVAGKRKNNPMAKQLSDPLWKMRVVQSKVLYNRKIKHRRSNNVGNIKK
jgi:hypothetical protein